MTISFFTNYVNHHQIPLADELYRILGDDYYYIATCDTQELVKAMSGYSEIERPYIIRSYANEIAKKKAFDLAKQSDVMIYGTPECLPYVKARYESARDKLTFEVGERWLKKGFLNFLSPRLLRYKWLYHTICPKERTFRLCASAYASHDEHLMLSYKDKCFKWGYFTSVPNVNMENITSLKQTTSTLKILWVARFLKWKHPEQMLQLALRLQSAHIDFKIDMIGEGPLWKSINNDITKLKLQRSVHLLGVMPNKEVIQKMYEYHIFCFTSDRHKGWGAVLNEAMSAGCCPVVCKAIGSAPFLIKHGENGLLYDDTLADDLSSKIEWLVTHRTECESMGVRAYETMRNEWNPKVAAERLVDFCKSFYEGDLCQYAIGPMSKADIL